MEVSLIIALFGVLMGITNAIVEVLKKATYNKIPTNVVAIIVAEILTVFAGVAYLQIKGIMIIWYMVVTLIVAGLLVAYAAMFGFDKLKEILNWKEQSK